MHASTACYWDDAAQLQQNARALLVAFN